MSHHHPPAEVTEAEVDEHGNVVYKKKVEAGLRKWVETLRCRRTVADEYFVNPQRPERDGIDNFPSILHECNIY